MASSSTVDDDEQQASGQGRCSSVLELHGCLCVVMSVHLPVELRSNNKQRRRNKGFEIMYLVCPIASETTCGRAELAKVELTARVQCLATRVVARTTLICVLVTLLQTGRVCRLTRTDIGAQRCWCLLLYTCWCKRWTAYSSASVSHRTKMAHQLPNAINTAVNVLDTSGLLAARPAGQPRSREAAPDPVAAPPAELGVSAAVASGTQIPGSAKNCNLQSCGKMISAALLLAVAWCRLQGGCR
jgi:hypothetical protein